MVVRMFNQLGVTGTQAAALARICGAVAARLWMQADLEGAARSDMIETTHALLLDSSQRVATRVLA
jgi:hypothetical protein